ncbi:suppressive immunomodulating factor, putative [Trypanosoma cruzi marinkellei]|uniref:Suppressive immunomodulating factor, putative n=1 Tax=Trypanosoma cruzi marinkellei TaxID=85056 RepID=K2MNQ3_TRYCR|nr:suppressive immunomodulating factor, putative [Trypanosoma cruzi marinkellei]
MSSAVTLRELDTLERADQPLLERFERCRHDVVRVSASSILHDCIAVTTKGGFVELINIDTGAFRLFLSHLGDTPLESLLRCFSLVPSLYAARGRHHLLYSLAYSNELLLADMEQGTVEVLARFHSRPSVVFCDGDYMVCGEGCGQVTLWRAPCEAGGAKLLWRRPVFSDTVLCISVQREYVFCSSADYRFYVLTLESGEVVATLPHEPAPAVAIQSAATSQVSHTLTVLCLPSVLSVYSPPPTEEDVSAATTVANSTWICTALLRLDVQISCASCCAGLMALGTASGVVLLASMITTNGEAVERVRFDVGFSVIGIQIFTNGELVVVTSAGDVWKWTIEDLLPREADMMGGQEEDEEEEEEKAENSFVPQPHMRPPDTRRVKTSAEAETAAAGTAASGDRVGMSDEEEIVVVVGDEASSTSSALWSEACHSVQLEKSTAGLGNPTGDGITEGNAVPLLRSISHSERTIPVNPIHISSSTKSTDTVTAADVVAHVDTATEDHVIAVRSLDKSASVAVISVNADEEKDEVNHSVDDDHYGEYSEHSFQPSSISIVAGTIGAADAARSVSLAPLQSEPNMNSRSAPHVAAATPTPITTTTTTTTTFNADPSARWDGAQLHQEDGVVVTAQKTRDAPCPPVSTASACSRALQCVLRGTDLGPPAVISGLRAGKRMDPRKARHIVENSCTDAAALPEPESQSSRILVDHRQALEEAKFDYAEYTKAHLLKAESLKYRYPVKLPVHGLHTHLFAAAIPRLQDRPNGNMETAENGDKRKNRRKKQQQQPIIDDLMNATFQNFTRRKDAVLEEERRRAAPDIQQHFCDSLLFSPVDPSGTVLFEETRVQLAVPNMLFLPMPLPPTPSVF